MVAVLMFILGLIFGSFYGVVGSRLPKGESIISPPSHCTFCNHRLSSIELIPVLSYIIQGGKCKNCGAKLSLFYPILELLTGVLFLISYLIFGFNLELIIPLTFISLLIIILVSDIEYMIISDEVLIFFGVILFVEISLINGLDAGFSSLLNGLGASLTMFLLKLFGDFLFKKESMGGGDIKLLFIFGMVLGFPLAILSIFVGSVIGLPISIIMMKKNSSHIIPFGPFLSAGACVILLSKIDFNTIVNYLS